MSSEAVAIAKNDYKVADISLADWVAGKSPSPKPKCRVSWQSAKNTKARSRWTAYA